MVSQTVSSAVQQTIERVTADLRASTPLADLARSGRFPPRALAFYLESLRYLFAQSELNVDRAIVTLRSRGELRYAEYFVEKIADERGHAAWAQRDLSQLSAAATRDIQPAQAVMRLIELQRCLFERHPLYFVVYILWAEYFTVIVGDEWVEALAGSGYEQRQLSAVVNHVEADREHVRAGFEALARLWRGEPSIAELCEAVELASSEFAAFCDEVCSIATQSVV